MEIIEQEVPLIFYGLTIMQFNVIILKHTNI